MVCRRMVLAALLCVAAGAAATPTPFIQTLSPPAVAPGAGSFPLTIYGANFAPGATVSFGGQSLVPNSITLRRIQVTVPASSVALAGTAPVTVMNPAASGVTSASPTVAFAIVNPSVNFSAGPIAGPKQFSSGSIVTGDFNRDGKLDLAIGGYGPSPTNPTFNTSLVNVYLGDGTGNFGAARVHADVCGNGLATSPLVVADFNGDAIPDIAAICESGLFAILLGDGSGGFSVNNHFAAATWGFAYNAVTADFNNDGHPDVVFPGGYPGGGNATILVGDGTGNFTPRPVSAPEGSFSVAAGDFNNDGKPDLAFTTLSRSVTIVFGDGAGNFSAGPSTTVPGQGGSLQTGDFNNDGNLDAVQTASSNGLDTAVILIGDGAGHLTISATLTLSAFSACAVGDFNGDGKLDLAFSGPIPLEVLFGDGKGGFVEAYRMGPDIFDLGESILAGDFNGDGRPDFVFNLFGQSAVRLQQPTVAPASYNIFDLCAPADCTLTLLSNGGWAAGVDVSVYPNWPGTIGFPKPGRSTFVPFSINRSGLVAGQMIATDGSTTAALWSVSPLDSQIWNLSSVDLSSTEATYVNDVNQIVGDSAGARPVNGLVPGDPLSRVYAETNNGIVLGTDINGPLAWSPTVGTSYLKTSAGVPTLLGPGSFNGIGQVILTAPSVGQVFTPGIGSYNQPAAPGFTVRAFNARGEFVGVQGVPPALIPSIYTASGGVVALSSLLIANSGWTLKDVTAINDNEQILAIATNGSRTTTLLLTPGDNPLLPGVRAGVTANGCVDASLNRTMRLALGCGEPGVRRERVGR